VWPVCVLWVRSYWRNDTVRHSRWDRGTEIYTHQTCTSIGGSLVFAFGRRTVHHLLDGAAPEWVTRPDLVGWQSYSTRLPPRPRPWPGVFPFHQLPFRFERLGTWTLYRVSGSVPHWSLALVLGVLPAAWLWRWRVLRRRARVGLCKSCGYDVRATPGRCPECGTPSPAAR
jgi:hypothetical protein